MVVHAPSLPEAGSKDVPKLLRSAVAAAPHMSSQAAAGTAAGSMPRTSPDDCSLGGSSGSLHSPGTTAHSTAGCPVRLAPHLQDSRSTQLIFLRCACDQEEMLGLTSVPSNSTQLNEYGKKHTGIRLQMEVQSCHPVFHSKNI